MKEFFKAFKTQNMTHRDYTSYFKPVLCYLEGAWTTPTQHLEESFVSDRHFLDASSWDDLQEKVSFTSYGGEKDEAENLAYLPVKIMENQNNTPIVAQWNYRIMCHPVEGELPTDRFQVVDDLGLRMARGLHINEFATTRVARFQLNAQNESAWEEDSFYDSEFLDDLMYQVPGVDNYLANITDNGAGPTGQTVQHVDRNEALNTG